MDETHYYILINRFLGGETTEKEKHELDAWLDASEENQRIFDEAEKLWHKVSVPQPDKTLPFEEFWQRLESELEIERVETPANVVPLKLAKQKHARSTPVSFRWLAVAAMLLLVVGVSFFYRVVLKSEADHVYVTKNAERLPVQLSDGSYVELNSASELRFEDSETLRSVTLVGQAFFQVEPDKRPFVVLTANAEIRVVGTSFDVRVRNQHTRIAVEEGKVAFSSFDDHPAVFLTTGQVSVVNQNFAPSKPVSVSYEHIGGWRQQKIVFEDTPLVEIIEELERVYDVEIIIDDTGLWRLAVTGVFEQQPIEEILSAICLTLNLKYRVRGEGYIISR